MYWIFGIIAPFVGGSIAASGFIVARKPDAADLLKKLAPYQGGIGVAMLATGVWSLLKNLGSLGTLLSSLSGMVFLATLFLLVLVGFLLGFGLIASWIPGEGEAEQKGVEMQKKLANYSAPLGLAAMGCAVFNLITFLF